MLAGMGRKEGRGVYPGVSDARLPPLYWQCMCVVCVCVCVKEEEGRLKGFVPVVNQLVPWDSKVVHYL